MHEVSLGIYFSRNLAAAPLRPSTNDILKERGALILTRERFMKAINLRISEIKRRIDQDSCRKYILMYKLALVYKPS